MGRNIAAGVAGVVIAVILVWLSDMIGHAVYPPPPDVDFTDMDAARAFIATLPVGAFAFVSGGWFAATLGGIVVACKIGTAQPIVFTTVVGAMMLAATAYNLTMIPHPLWFSITGVTGIVLAAWLGLTICNNKDEIPDT